MSTGSGGATGTARAIVDRGREVHLTFLSAAVAYYALVSLVPLVALAALAVTLLAGEAFAAQVLAIVGDSLSASGREAVRRILTTAAGQTQAGIIGGVVLLWGASRLFRGLNHAFSEVYGAEDPKGFVGHLRDAVVALVGVLLAVVVVLGVELVPFFDQLGGWLAGAIRLALLAVLLLPLYYVLPNVPTDVGDALPGALLAALGWTVLYATFDLYVGMTSASALGGVVGGVVLLVTLLYVAAFVLLVGAVVNAILVGR